MLSTDDLADGATILTGDPEQSPIAVVDLSAAEVMTPAALTRASTRLTERSVVTVGLSRTPLGPQAARLAEGLACTLAPGGRGRAWIDADDHALERIVARVTAGPLASLTLANLLPITYRSTVPDGLVLESLAYSTLLAGPEFRGWRARTPRREVPRVAEPVIVTLEDDRLRILLNRPERHNAFGRQVRDGLLDALALADLDHSITEVTLAGAGGSFCSGGDLDEFGTAADPASAHVTRLGASAGLAVHRMRDRIRPRLHGACIGAGIEVPAFAAHVEADASAFFELPELRMGLVPGAGGTVSVCRRIGPQRTAYLVLSGDRIDAARALAWELVDTVG